MFCKFCGTQLNDNAVFCNKCGNRIKSAKTNLVDYSALSLGEEIKKSKFLFVIPFLYLVWSFIVWYVKQFGVIENITYGEIFANMTFVIFALFWGALSYAASKRTVKFTLIFVIPYLFFSVSYSFISGSFKYMGEYLFYLVDFVGRIITPFAILGMIRIVKTLMGNLKSKIFLGIVSTITTIIFFSIYIIAIGWISDAECGMRFHFPMLMILVYAAGICVSSILMHAVYKGR